MNKSYLHIYVCVYVRWRTKNTKLRNMCRSLNARLCMHVGGDVEVHEKLSSLNDGKHANFVWANTFSLAVRPPTFWLLSFCRAVSSCDKQGKLRMSEAVRERAKEKEKFAVESVKYIGFLVKWPVPNTRFIFVADNFLRDSKRVDVFENTGTWLLCPIRFRKQLFLFMELMNFGFYFSRIFHFTSSSPTGLKI